MRNVDRGANASTSAAAGAGTCLGAHRAGWRGHRGKRGRCAYTPEGQNTRIAIYTISEFRSWVSLSLSKQRARAGGRMEWDVLGEAMANWNTKQKRWELQWSHLPFLKKTSMERRVLAFCSSHTHALHCTLRPQGWILALFVNMHFSAKNLNSWEPPPYNQSFIALLCIRGKHSQFKSHLPQLLQGTLDRSGLTKQCSYQLRGAVVHWVANFSWGAETPLSGSGCCGIKFKLARLKLRLL